MHISGPTKCLKFFSALFGSREILNVNVCNQCGRNYASNETGNLRLQRPSPSA
jgi:hypothetical protein